MMHIRKELVKEDIQNIRSILQSTGFFDQAPDEIDVATELVEIALNNGNNVENYQILIAEDETGTMSGYVCFARVPCTLTTFEMYWLCVNKAVQSRGIGQFLVDEVFKMVKELGGHKVVLQTAGRSQYLPTQQFYLHYGFILEASIKDYYAPGDDCLTFTKEIV